MTKAQPLRRELAAAIEDAVSPVLNQRIGPGLPPLRWTVRHAEGLDVSYDGQASAGDYDELEVRQVVEKWARALSCELSECLNGTVEVRCWTRDVYVVVWGVVDRGLFEKGRSALGKE